MSATRLSVWHDEWWIYWGATVRKARDRTNYLDGRSEGEGEEQERRQERRTNGRAGARASRSKAIKWASDVRGTESRSV